MQTIVLAIVGLFSMIVGLILALVLPEIKLLAYALIALGIILVASAAIIDFRRVKGAVTSRRGKFGASTTIMVSVFAGIIIFVNAISVGVNHQFDFTALAQFSLTSQTKAVLAKIKIPINVIFFVTPADDQYHSGAYGEAMILQYMNYTNELKVQVIDPDQHPEEARKYNITEYQSVVFESALGTSLVTPEEVVAEAEHAFTNAILEVTGIVQRKVYFLTGDGEASLSDTLSDAADALQTNLLQVISIDLQVAKSIPDDCALLVVDSPTQAMSDSERQIIAGYLSNDGAALFLTDPNAPSDVAQLLKPWGVDVQSGTIIDPSSYATPNIDNPTVTRNRSALNIITSTVYFPGATAIIPQSTMPTGMQVQPLVWTTTDAWIDNNFDPSVTPKYNPATEKKAAYAIGVLINPSEVTDSQGNVTSVNQGPYIVAFGDSDFITNSHFNDGNNSDLFLSMVKILSAGSDIMPIDQKVLTTRRLILSPEAASFLNISSIALLPAIVLIIGAIMWWRRK
jgi:ABC-type uncharacterized transport system involved in gliding motility auxiliary subunit